VAKNKITPADDVLLTDQASADRLGVSLATVRRMRRDGELAFVRVRGAVRVPQSELQSYMAANRLGGAA
jgi:excisionase family DNA binding protein